MSNHTAIRSEFVLPLRPETSDLQPSLKSSDVTPVNQSPSAGKTIDQAPGGPLRPTESTESSHCAERSIPPSGPSPSPHISPRATFPFPGPVGGDRTEYKSETFEVTEADSQSQRSTLRYSLSSGNMSPGTIKFFHGLKNGQEDADEFIEEVEDQAARERYTTIEATNRSACIYFRTHLKGTADRWYRGLSADVRSRWADIKQRFLKEYEASTDTEESLERYYDIIYSIGQRGRHIVQYVEDVERIYAGCPTSLHRLFGRQFVAGLDDRSKIGLTQIYLNGAKLVAFPEAKEAVIKAFSPIGEAGPFDDYHKYCN